MAGQKKSVFLVGPGFIGRNVLDLLVADGYAVTTMVRRQEQIKVLEDAGANVVVGGLDDSDKIAGWAAEHEITFHAATADHLPSSQAIVEGIRRRAAQGKPSIYIHTSGTSALDDKAMGNFRGDEVYDDNDRAKIDALPDDNPHRLIDLSIVRAQQELGDKAKLAIMIPPAIYGLNPKHKRVSIQLPTITRFALKHGYVPYYGKGLPIESQVHVLDLAQAYMVLLLEVSPPSYVIENPYFFATNGEVFEWREVAERIAKALYDKGRLPEPKTATLPLELEGELFGPDTHWTIGLNSLSVASRLRGLGWTTTQKNIWSSFVDDELPVILEQA